MRLSSTIGTPSPSNTSLPDLSRFATATTIVSDLPIWASARAFWRFRYASWRSLVRFRSDMSYAILTGGPTKVKSVLAGRREGRLPQTERTGLGRVHELDRVHGHAPLFRDLPDALQDFRKNFAGQDFSRVGRSHDIAQLAR